MITCYVALQLGYTTCLVTIAFIRFLLRISGFMIILLYLLLSASPLVFYSISLLLLSDYTMSLPCLISYLSLIHI